MKIDKLMVVVGILVGLVVMAGLGVLGYQAVGHFFPDVTALQILGGVFCALVIGPGVAVLVGFIFAAVFGLSVASLMGKSRTKR